MSLISFKCNRFDADCAMQHQPYALGEDVEATGARLGKGAFANVKLVQHRPTGKHLALKVIDLSNSGDYAGESAQIMTECQVHKSLSHPNIIHLYDYSREDRKINLLLEYASKGDFYKFLQSRKKIPEEEALKVVFQLAQALKYLHSMDIIHRDLKLENVLIMEDGRYKLCDFGWCSPPNDTSRNILCGTYEYMAPEVAQRIKYTSKIDMWSLGILAYELVHSYSPFAAPNPQAILKNITTGEFDIDSSLSRPYQEMLKGLIENAPQRRLSAEELLSLPVFQVMHQDYVPLRMSVRPTYRPSMLSPGMYASQNPYADPFAQNQDVNQSVYLGSSGVQHNQPQLLAPVYQPTNFTQAYEGPPLEWPVEENFDLKDLQQFVVIDIDIATVKEAVGEGLKAAGGFLEGIADFFRDMIQNLDDDKKNGRRERKKREEVEGKYRTKQPQVPGPNWAGANPIVTQAKERLDNGEAYANFGMFQGTPGHEIQLNLAEEKRFSESTSRTRGTELPQGTQPTQERELRRANTDAPRAAPPADVPWWQELFGFLGSGENDELKEKLKQKDLEDQARREKRRRDREDQNNF